MHAENVKNRRARVFLAGEAGKNWTPMNADARSECEKSA